MPHDGKDMSELVLLRHGQASLYSENYDQLSSLGEEQCRLLAAHWSASPFARILSGPAERQKRTAELVAGPGFEVVPAWDEMPFQEVMRAGIRRAIAKRPMLIGLAMKLRSAKQDGTPPVTFQPLFETVMRCWADGELEDVESWVSFRARIEGALDQALAVVREGHRVLVSTSSGPIAVALLRARKLNDQDGLALFWQSLNAS
jgi:broad specificity phosphatase PhoE